MDKIAFYPTSILALIFIAIYYGRCSKKGISLNVATLINVIFQSGGIIVGIFLAVSTFSNELRDKLVNIDLYVFISGIAIIAVSAQGLRKGIYDETKRN